MAAWWTAACAGPAPGGTLRSATSCDQLAEVLPAYTASYVGSVDRAPVREVFSFGVRAPPRVQEFAAAIRPALARAQQLDCDDRALRELVHEATREARAGASGSARLFAAAVVGEHDSLRQLRRALVVTDEAQRLFHGSYGVYALTTQELRSVAGAAIEEFAGDATIEVHAASQSSYCASVAVGDLPPVYVGGPGRSLSAEGCP